MKIAGIIAGLGPETTVDYYRMIIAGYRERQGRGYPHLVINSLDVDKGIAMLDAGRLDELADYLASGFEVLEHAGCDFGLMAANTPHIVFDQLERRTKLPLLSIVRVTAEKARSLGLKRVGLFGTGFTMRAAFYPEEFKRIGIELVTPAEPEREFIHKKYIGELLNNQFLPETRDSILRIVQGLKSEEEIEALVLAGTELPLLLRGSDAGVPFLDTTVIHVEAVVEEILR